MGHLHERLRSAFHPLDGSRLREFELQLAFTHIEISDGLRILLNELVQVSSELTQLQPL